MLSYKNNRLCESMAVISFYYETQYKLTLYM
nr:MAG TPA: hypothetical protein [Caudoviricetes sp.]